MADYGFEWNEENPPIMPAIKSVRDMDAEENQAGNVIKAKLVFNSRQRRR
jgi:hypothetical protein